MEITDKLIMQAICGDQDAITKLYEGTYSNVYHTIKSMVKDEDAVLDILQDTYVKAFDSLVQLENPAQFRPWVKRIATNKAKDYVKKRKPILFSEMAAEDSDEPIDFEDNRWTDLPETVVDRKETTRLMNEILATLSEDQQLVVGMFYYQEMSVKQIAKILGVSENTVKSRLNYARKKIETKVLDLEKKGTKLYSLAPLPFFLWLLRGMDAVKEVPSAAVLDAVCAETVVGYTSTAGTASAGAKTAATGSKAAARAGAKAAGSGAKAAASAGAKAAAGGTAKALGVKIAAGVLAVVVAGGGAVAWAGSQKDEQPDTPSFVATEEANLPAEAGAEPQATEQAEAAVSPDTAYQGIVGQYADVLGANSQEFLNNPDGYYNGDHALVFYYHAYPGMQFQYAYHDINKDGTDELLIGADGIISDVYGFDGANAVQLIDEPSMGDRSQLTIHEDGTLALVGSSGADSTSYNYWKLNGTTLADTSPSNSEAVSDFNWQPIEATAAQEAPTAGVGVEGAYEAVLNQYLNAMGTDKETAQNAVRRYYQGENSDLFGIDEEVMRNYYSGNWFYTDAPVELYYSYYDIDHNGVYELLIGMNSADWRPTPALGTIYGFDGTQAKRLTVLPIDYANSFIQTDGTIHTDSCDGWEITDVFNWHLSSDGASLVEVEPSEAAQAADITWHPLNGDWEIASKVAADYDAILNDVRAICALPYEDWNANQDYYAQTYSYTGAAVNWILQQERVVEAYDGVHTFGVFWGTGDLNGDLVEDLLLSYGRMPELGTVRVLYLSGQSAPIVGDDVNAYLPEGKYPEEYATWHRDIDVYYG